MVNLKIILIKYILLVVLINERSSIFIMNANELKNNKIIDIYILEDEIYSIIVSYKENYLADAEDYYFSLVERNTEQTFVLKHKIVSKENDFLLIELSFSMERLIYTTGGKIWDIYVNRKIDNKIKSVRVKSNYDYIRFLSKLLPSNKMFYPYTTKKGNLSFKLNDYILYTEVDSAQLSADKRKLHVSGFFNFPPLFLTNDYKVLNLELVVKLKDDEIFLPVSLYNREDIFEKYHGNENLLKTGFKAEIPYLEYSNPDEKTFLKLYLDMTYQNKAGQVLKIRSTRVRLNPFKTKKITKIIKYNKQKYKMLLKPTRRSKYLSLQIKKYEVIKELKTGIKTSWVKFRRGRKSRLIYKRLFSLVGKLPASNRTIVFESFHGKQFSDSPRAIFEYLCEHNYNYKMYWSADRRHIKVFEDKNVKYIRRYSLKWLFVMARAKYWVINARLPLWLPKPKHTIYLQTWHGTPLKRLAADMEEVHMPGTNTEKYKRNFINEASRWDYLVSPNAYSTEIFTRAFQFKGNIIESGYPRNDFLINSNNNKTIERLKNKMNLPLNKKIVLYAPTWRDNQFYQKGKYKFEIQMDLDKMKKELGNNYIVLLRLHYLIAENLDLAGYENFVYDFSKHEDIRELYLVSDILITDYSSVFFDYANLKRPMIFFVYDIEDYRDNLRGFYFDFEEKAPGPLVRTTEEIISEIKNIEENDFTPSERIELFYEKFCYLEDGNATGRVVNEMFK